MLETTLRNLRSGLTLSEEEMSSAMKEIMEGKTSEDEIVSFLILLRDKGEVLSEIVGAARVMREFSVKVSLSPENLVDTCGTGGDSQGTFNISTAAGLVVAGAGVRVAKHGNRAVSSKAGSADILEALGVRIDLDPIGVRRCLSATGFGFFFAPNFHPAMKHVAAARKKIGTKTIFNLLGPLTNPAGPLAQVIGVYDRARMLLMAEAVKALGCRHVMLVHGSDGLDEVTLTGKTDVVSVREGIIGESEFDPQDYDLAYCALADLKGRDVDFNATLMRGLLEGYVSPLRDAVVINAAAALFVSGRAASWEEGIVLANHSLDQGKAYEILKDVIRISNE